MLVFVGEPKLPHYAKGVQFLKATHYPQRDEILRLFIIKEIKMLLDHIKTIEDR
jgi:hypothetical protein